MNDIKHKDTSILNSHSAKQILRVQFAILLTIKSKKVLEFYNFLCNLSGKSQGKTHVF